MTEFLNSPALIPTLIGFLVGVVFTAIFAANKGRLARSIATAKQEIADQKIEALQATKIALDGEVSSLRSSEASLLQHQDDLEALKKNNQERREEMTRFLETTRTTLEEGFQKQESTLLEAIREVRTTPIVPKPVATTPIRPSTVQDDRDFVPLQNAPESPAPATPFEGFASGPNAAKAESAANALRAALNETDQ